jgi:sigma-B regulation protein RsbU (phosphoserine phosphatase)
MHCDESRVLIVDDNPHDRALLEAFLSPEGYEIEMATDGMAGKDLLEGDPGRFDVVLLDRNMPRMSGVELLQFMKAHAELKAIPVILQTASDSRSDLIEAMRAGALYYLTKPYDSEMLLNVVATAAIDRANHRRLQQTVRSAATSLRVMQSARFSVQTIEEARDLGAILAGLCADPQNAVIGLTELLVNAVEHGNLGITYDEKTGLNASGRWQEEVDRRLALPENASKRVEVLFERDGEEIRFTIRDQGRGFDWRRYVEADPLRAFDTHGRGILIATRLTFDQLEYRGSGNEVVGRIRRLRA